MKIDRPLLISSLSAFVKAGHGLVVGAPGGGKTHSLRLLAEDLEHAGTPFLWLAVDSLGTATDEDIRNALGYEGSFADAISQLYGASPTGGVVIVDGFDAARDTDVRSRVISRIESLLELAPSEWRVVVSVRLYDATKSPHLLALFGTLLDAEGDGFRQAGIKARHFSVPILPLAAAVDAASTILGDRAPVASWRPEFLEALRLPFNLWLLERLLTNKATDRSALDAVRSEVELMAMYWRMFVETPADDAARRRLLASITQHMIADRALVVRKEAVYEGANDATWRALLSEEVLVERGPGATHVAFQHNLLFDFAVATLAIAKTATGVSEFLTQDTARLLLLRPSLVYFYMLLWHRERAVFWDCFWPLLLDNAIPVRLVARLIPPYVIASQATLPEDLAPLLNRISTGDPSAGLAATRVLFALRFVGVPRASLWASFAANASASPTPVFVWPLAQMIHGLLEQKGVASETLFDCGRAGRALLRFALDGAAGSGPDWTQSFGANLALPIVTRTFATDLPQSRALVAEVLASLESPPIPLRYAYAITDRIQDLFAPAPDIAVAVYRAIFGQEEESKETTALGGIVLPLTSNRRQDFEMCQYALGRAYKAFLAASPSDAVAAALIAVNGQAAMSAQRYGIRAEGVSRFRFMGRDCYLDHRDAFALTLGPREYVGELVGTLRTYLESDECAVRAVDVGALFATHARAVSGWGVLLEAAAVQPRCFAPVSQELILVPEILLCSELAGPLGKAIASSYAYWTDDVRRAFEERVLALPTTAHPTWDGERLKRWSRWLISKPPSEALVTPSARQAAGVDTQGDGFDEDEGMRITTSSRRFTQDDWLAERGIKIDEPDNVSLRALRDELADLGSNWTDKTPSPAQVPEALTLVESALGRLESPGAAASEVVESVATKAAEVAAAIARTNPSPASHTYSVCLRCAKVAGAFPPPLVEPDRNATYVWPHWSPTPRTEAIRLGADLLASGPQAELCELMRMFVNSPEPSERFLAFRYAPVYGKAVPDLFWEVLETVVNSNETNIVVAQGCLTAAGWSPDGESPRRESIVRSVVTRLWDSAEGDLLHLAADWVTHYALVLERAWAKDLIAATVASATVLPDAVDQVVQQAARMMAPRRRDVSLDLESRLRAREWLVHLFDGLPALIEKEPAEPDGAVGALFAAAHKMVGHTVDAVYFGLRSIKQSEDDEDNPGSSGAGEVSALVRQHYELVNPVVTAILRFSENPEARGLAAPTAYHLMEALREFVGVDPGQVIKCADRVVLVSRNHGYQFDSLAVRELVELVETTLADHRDALATPDVLSALLRLLDAFADAGWPEAMDLVWRLDEVLR